MAVFRNPFAVIKKLTIFTLVFTACIGAVMVLVQIKPFWVDEWFIIDSLKTKNAAGIFGQLDFMQQFPRVYLVLLKVFTSFFNYSYYSLRLPAFLVSMGTIVLSYRVMKKIYDAEVFSRYLFVLVLVSSFTFTEYFVEMKQYSMEIFMSIVALWQLYELLRLKNDDAGIVKYFFLCATLFVAPFFSYTYPIAIAPVYAVIFLQTVPIFKSNRLAAAKWRTIGMQWFPLIINVAGIALFYALDARHLTSDKTMYDRWSFLIMNNDNKLYSTATGFYTLFSQTGNGLLFETLFGILGIGGFLYGIVSCVKDTIKSKDSIELQFRVYSCLLIILTLALFLCRKLPLGTPRLNAFTTPAIAMLIIFLLDKLYLYFGSGWKKMILPVILYLGVAGNVFSHYINYFTSPVYKKQMQVYNATENAIRLAQEKKIPILITSGVAYPYERATKDAGAPDPAVWVLKTFPAYRQDKHLPVYEIQDLAGVNDYMKQLPPGVAQVLAGDGISFKIYDRQH